ncbi:MAG: AAA family ATPase [Candidatus Limnocylindria bacterium]
MTCPTCNAENPAGTRFCLECGTRLGQQCQSCRAPRVGEAKFCGECGTPFANGEQFASPGIAGTASIGVGPAPVAERRLVSVLFADLVGFTPFAEERDSEDVRETLSRYFDLAAEVIIRYGGTVEKFIGDAVMAVWGAPTAQEDDAERSVRAALDLVDAVRSLGPGIQARAGILTGEAAVTLGATNQGMVAGDLVNTASRLQGVADPGSVLVDEPTMRAASAAIAFESAGEREMKGKAAPLPAWRAVRVVAERGGRGRSDTLEAPFVGRDDELRLLKELFHATGRERRVRLVSVMGPAGIGKSRLGWEFLKYVDGVLEPVWWHTGRSPSYGEGITFWALGEMVRRRAGLAAEDDEATTRARIAESVIEHVRDDAERRWIEPALLALLGIGTESANSEQLFGAWRTFFERMAETGLVALVFEDLHWADSVTLDFIEHLLEWSRASPIFIVTLARPDLLERRPAWGAGKRNFAALYLEPLPEAAMRELLAGLVPGLPENAVRAIVARADGIPLYAVETVRTLLAEGRLTLEGDRYVPTQDLAHLSVPETLQALIAARLDALDPADRSLVSLAAVLGQSFTLAGLAAVGGTPEDELEPRGRDLVRRELFVHNADPRSPERGQYAFVQGLIREVAYSMLAKRDRKSHHIAAARYFESVPTDELSGALALHYFAAHENAPDGPEADALAAQARIALKAAAERATGLGVHAQAASYLRQALTITTDPADQAALLEQAGLAASRAGHHQEADELLERAVKLSREAGDVTATVRSTTRHAEASVYARQVSRALALLEPAAAEFADLREPGVAALHGQLARAIMIQGLDDRAGLAVSDRVLEVAEQLELTDVVADTLVTKGMGLLNLGRGNEGLGLVSTGLEMARANKLADIEMRALGNLAVTTGTRNVGEGLRLTRELVELERRMGVKSGLTIMNAAEIARWGGDWDWADDLQSELLTSDLEGVDRVFALAIDVLFKAARGEPAAGEHEELDRLAAELDDPSALVIAVAVRPELYLYAGRLQEARLEAESQAQSDTLNATTFLTLGGHAAVWDGDLESLKRVYRGLVELGGRGPLVAAQRRAMQAGIDGLEGRRTDALAGFRQAIREFDEIGAVLDGVFTAIDMAAALGSSEPEVRTHIDRARATLEGLRAKALLDRLDAAVRRPVGDASGVSASTAGSPVNAAS